MNSRQNRLSNVLLGISCAAIVYDVARLFTAISVPAAPWIVIPVVGASLAAVLLFSMFISFPSKLNMAVMTVTLTASFAIGTFMLKAVGRDLIDIVDAKLVRPFSISNSSQTAMTSPAAFSSWESARPPDPRPVEKIVEVLKEQGFTFSPYFNPYQLLDAIEAKMLPPPYPLGSASYKFGGNNSISIGCNEGDLRDYPIGRKDRYGFNNDDTVYAYKDLYMLVGGSFFMGSCVHQSDTLQGVMRRNGYPAISMGFGGSAAISAVANLKEYGETFKPKAVLWQFYDPNDITQLTKRELRSSFLLQYLRDGFSQSLINRQPELDAMWEKGQWSTAAESADKDPQRKAEWEKKLETNLPLVQELLGSDIKSLSADDDLLLIYERILAIAKRRVAAWGGRLYLVLIPNEDTYLQGTIPKYTRRVVDSMSKLEVPVIDVDQALRATGSPLRFHANPNGWSHFNADGYRLMAQQIMRRLDQDFPPGAPKIAGNK